MVILDGTARLTVNMLLPMRRPSWILRHVFEPSCY